MKNVIIFFGSFDPLHNGHISIIKNAIKKVNAQYLYIGINKSSSKGSLTPIEHRISMLKEYARDNNKIKILNFMFDYKNLDKSYDKIFNLMKPDTNYYILIGQDQLNNLSNWYNYQALINKFSFIVAKRGNMQIPDNYLNDHKFIFIDHDFKHISSSNIKSGEYEYTHKLIVQYIIKHNLYLKNQVKSILSLERYKHSLSVSKTALLINKKANLGLDKYKIEKAALLHDIAKELSKQNLKKLTKELSFEYQNENENIIHQYLGEYIAKNQFHVFDEDILNAIKYHTTGRANMSVLEKLIFVSDKIEPRRKYNNNLLDACISNFEKGFISVLKNNKKYLENKGTNLTNKDTLNCFKYYL